MPVAGASLKPAFVLHRRRYRDSSLLLELFSESEGRLAVIARGALAGRSGRAGLLQPFIPLLVDWRGRGEVRSLGNVEAAGPGIPLHGKALYCGFYVNELLVRLAQRHDRQLLLFARYGQTLVELAAGADLERTLRRFELTVLQALGSAAELAVEADGQTPVMAEKHYRVSPDTGPVAVSPTDAAAISGETLLCLAHDEPLADNCRREARRLLRGILAHHLGDRPLKSRELFQPIKSEEQ